MVHSARPIRYIVSGLPTSNSATAGRRPLTPRTTTQVRLLKQLLDKLTGALLALPQQVLDALNIQDWQDITTVVPQEEVARRMQEHVQLLREMQAFLDRFLIPL